MIKRLLLSLGAVVALAACQATPAAAAQSQPGISQKVAPCDWSYPNRCLKVEADGSINVNGGGGGGGGAVTVADGADVTQGALADAAATAGGTGSVSAKLRTVTGQLNTQAGYLDGIEALIATTNSTLTTINTNLGTAGTTAYTGSGAGDPNTYLRAIANAALDTAPATVNLTQIGGNAVSAGNGTSGTGVQRVTLASDSTGQVALASGSTVGLATGSNIVGFVGIDQTTPGTTNLVSIGSNGLVGLSAPTTGGCTLSGTQSAASTNATSVKASAGTLCGGMVINTTATLYYLRLYNLAAAPTCSSATGFLATIPVPASTSGAGTLLDFGAYGLAFGTGVSFCLTGGGSSTDNTNAAAGVYINIAYK